MSKPREFWIKFAGIKDVIYTTKPNMSPGQWGDYPDSDCLHVRQVIPIDWEKIKQEVIKMEQTHYGLKEIFNTIQQLVEKQLAGE